MPSKLIFLLLVFSHSHFNLQSQEDEEIKLSYRKQQKIYSGQLINQLHNGTLLVSLNNKQRAVEALRSVGKHDKADKIDLKQKNFNKAVVKAFRENFNFSSVYFFYNDYSYCLENKDIKSIVFLNDSLIPDSTIRPVNNIFLTAEFNMTVHDTARHFNGYYFVIDKDGRKRRKSYYGRPLMRFGALVIKSDQFVQLRRPFPYYVRTYDTGPIRRKPGNAVRRMNKKLYRYFYKVNNK